MSDNLLGKQFKTRGKHPRLCTVVDVHKTYNKDGNLVKTAYVAEHDFLGQKVITRDICSVTILRNEVTA